MAELLTAGGILVGLGAAKGFLTRTGSRAGLVLPGGAAPAHVRASTRALTDQEIVELVYKSNPDAAARRAQLEGHQDLERSLASESFAGFDASACGGGSRSVSPTLTSLGAGQFALSIAPVHTALGGSVAAGTTGLIGSTLTGLLTFGVGAALSIFGVIYAHHAAQVRAEMKLVCAGVPAAQDALGAIEDAFTNGRISLDQAYQALDQLRADWQHQIVEPGKAQGVYKQCDALCVYTADLEAIILKKKNRYAAAGV